MSQTWIIDSNCFIHLGSMAPDTFIRDLKKVLSGHKHSLFVTTGVHGEIQNVRFQRWSKKPKVLDEFMPLMTTVTIDENQVKGLAQLIGEKRHHKMLTFH